MQNTHTRTSSTDEEISLKGLILKIQEWWHYLLTKWLAILIIGMVGGILGIVYSIFKTPTYTAKLVFVLEDTNSNSLSNLGGLAAIAGFSLGEEGNGLFQGDNILELYKSRSILSKTLLSKSNGNDSLLIDRYIAFNDLHKEWEDDPMLKNIKYSIPVEQFTLQHDSLLGEIVKDIKEENLQVFKPDNKLSFIQVETTASNEGFAKDFTEVLVQNVNEFYVETKTKKALENLTILQHQTDSVRRALNDAIAGVASAMDVNPNANPARQVLRVPSTKRQVDVQANEAILTELVKNLEISKISLRKETPLIQVIDTPILPLKKEEPGMVKGFIIGGLLAGFLMCIFLIGKLIIKEIMQGDV